MKLLGVDLVGLNPTSGTKLLLTGAFVVGIEVARRVLRMLAGAVLRGHRLARAKFWVREALSVLAALAIIVCTVSIWFDDPTRLTTALGLVTAGLAFALQKVVTALAGYIVILRGKTFSVGDRIVLGGVRGDVIDLGFIHTSIMEMGQPPSISEQADPAMWVRSRQYTGRIVTVSNARVFDDPVFNYTRELPYLWEEMKFPIGYTADRERAEQILLDVCERATHDIQELGANDRAELERRYMIAPLDARPRVYFRMTDNWLELTVRFLAKEHAIRSLKDEITRDVLRRFDEAGISIASATFEVVGLPPLRLQTDGRREAPSISLTPRDSSRGSERGA